MCKVSWFESQDQHPLCALVPSVRIHRDVVVVVCKATKWPRKYYIVFEWISERCDVRLVY